MVAFSDLTQVMQNARTDAKTLDEYVHGAADTQVTSRLGKRYWTLATLDNKLSLVKIKAEKTLADIDTLAKSATDSITAKSNSANTTIDNKVAQANSDITAKVANANTAIDSKVAAIDTRANEEIGNLQDAINTAAAAGAGANGWDANLVAYGEVTQKQFNDGLESIAQLNDIQNPSNGMRVYDSTKANINDGVVTFNGWVRQIDGFITPFMAGAYDDPTKDSSAALNKAITYAAANKVKLTGLSKTFSCSNVLVPSNLDFRDAFLQCSIFNVDNTHVLMTKISKSFDNPTKNVYMENIIIDGKRSLHTNVGNAGDGGRSGFAILDVCQDITLVNCKANNCVTDGFGFFPNGISFGTRNNMLNNVKLIDCEAHWNGRHGGSSDAENGLHFIRGKYQNNGKSLIEGAPYDTGNSARLLEGAGTRMYGAGWDFETYSPETHIRDVLLENVDMRDNSASSVTFYRVHDPIKGVNNNIRIIGGKFNSASVERAAIEFTTFNNENPITHTLFDGVVIDGADIGGRSLVLIHTNARVSNLLNYGRIEIGGIGNITLDNDYSNLTNYNPETTKLQILSNKTRVVDLGKFYQDTKVNIQLSGEYGSKSSIDVVTDSDKRGGIGFHITDTGGINTFFYNRNVAHTAITQEGSIFPQVDNVSSIGNGANRFKDIYVASGVIATSDARFKEDINELTTKELLVAQSLKRLIKSYKFKGCTRTHIGVLAQEVEAAFAVQGLNAFDYGLLCLDKWDANDAVVDENGVEIIPKIEAGYRYAVRYDELIMFILGSI